jgi:hypothetical protein
MKYLVCTAALIAFVWGLRSIINEAFAFNSFAGDALCIGGLGICLAIGFAVDRRDRRVQQGQQPPQR